MSTNPRRELFRVEGPLIGWAILDPEGCQHCQGCQECLGGSVTMLAALAALIFPTTRSVRLEQYLLITLQGRLTP